MNESHQERSGSGALSVPSLSCVRARTWRDASAHRWNPSCTDWSEPQSEAWQLTANSVHFTGTWATVASLVENNVFPTPTCPYSGCMNSSSSAQFLTPQWRNSTLVLDGSESSGKLQRRQTAAVSQYSKSELASLLPCEFKLAKLFFGVDTFKECSDSEDWEFGIVGYLFFGTYSCCIHKDGHWETASSSLLDPRWLQCCTDRCESCDAMRFLLSKSQC